MVKEVISVEGHGVAEQQAVDTESPGVLVGGGKSMGLFIGGILAPADAGFVEPAAKTVEGTFAEAESGEQ